MPQPIRVLQTIRQGLIGGGESHVLTLIRHMDRSRFEPVVLSFTPGPMVDQLQEAGIRTHVIETQRPFDIRTWRHVRQLLQREDIQLVHAHGTRALTNVFQATNDARLPLLYTVHGWSFHNDLPPLIRQSRIMAERYLTSRANLTICVSEADQQLGRLYFPHFQSKLVFYGIDSMRFSPQAAGTDVRAQYGIRPDQTVIGFLARMTHQKEPLTLIRAYARLALHYPDSVLLMIGSGELKDQARALVRELNLERQVILDDFRQDVPDVLRAIDIFCLPSLWEGMPIGLIEALYMGKAVVASAIGGTSELIRDNVNGLLVPVRNADRLAQSIAALISDTDLRRRLEINAVHSVADTFGAPRMTRHVERIYDDLLGQMFHPVQQSTNVSY